MKITEDNTLVVPIRLEALAVNQNFKGKPVRRWCMDYARLQCKKNAEPFPLDEDIDRHYFDQSDHWGVYLHWIMPAALRKGDQTNEIETDFPALPNRWLVARRYKDASGDDHAFKFWFIKSDEIVADNNGGAAFGYVDSDGKIHAARIGKSYDLDKYKGDIFGIEKATFRNAQQDGESPPQDRQAPVSPRSLNAVGLGNVNFLAYQPFVNDVFSFHDDLKDLRRNDESTITALLHYSVAGWYSNPDDDVLHRGKIENVAKLFDALNWRVKDPDGSGLDNLQRTIYYGRKSQVDWQKATHIVDTFKDDQLEVVFGNNALDAMTALLEKTDYGKGFGKESLQFLKPFMYGKLPLVNEPGGFIRLNQEMRKTWFKAKSGGRCWVLETKKQADVSEPEVENEVQELLTKLNVQQEAIEQAQVELEELQKLFYDAWWQKVETNNAGDDGTEALKQSKLAKLIRKKNDALNQSERILDDIFKNLYIRLSGHQEELNAEEVQRRLNEHHGLAEMGKTPFWKPHDPAILIAGVVPKKPAVTDETLDCLLPAQLNLSSGANIPNVIGNNILSYLLNDFIARQAENACQWEQPWNPLFLEWEVEWLPIFYQPEQAKGEEPPRGQMIKGRTFLTSQNSQLLGHQLENLKAMTLQEENESTDSALKALEAFVSGIVRHSPLSQNLLDFNSKLQMRNNQLSITPQDEELKDLIGEQYQSQPIVTSSEPSNYHGIRQGCFNIKHLEIYDGFGQCLVLVGPQGLRENQTFTPVKDNDLCPSKDMKNSERLIALKPRILEYSRLRFDYVDTHDNMKIMDIHQDVNPIVGWVLYNHVDRSLVLFNDLGEHLGELRVVRGKVTNIDFKQNNSKAFEKCISQIPKNAQLFNLFLNIIDETLWAIEPNANMQEQHLAVWFGRPLAIVHTRLRLEVCGAGQILLDGMEKSANNDPIARFKQKHQQIRDFHFNIRLGSRGIRQDGLIGYFLDGVFYTVHDLKAIPSSYTGSIRPIREGLMVSDPGQWTQYLTLLVDPGAAVYAQTDFLPYTSLRLPDRFVNQALDKIQVTFRNHCILTHLDEAVEPGGRDQISMPLPALRKGTWEWIENQKQKFDIQSEASASQKLVAPALLRDGRLKLLDPFRKKTDVT